MHQDVSRRTALRAAARTGAAAAVASATSVGTPFLHAGDKTGPVTVGSGDWTYQWAGDWGELPDGFAWGNVHGVCQAADGTIFVTHQAEGGPVRDVILAFDPDGRFVRSWGEAFHGGGHGLDLRDEGGTEYLYLTDLSQPCTVKFTLDGEEVRRWGKPAGTEWYGPDDRYMATNVAFTPDGGFFIADGYGTSQLLRYDAAGELVRCVSGLGRELGRLQCCHGAWWDDRPGREPALAVADRSNNRVSYFDADGDFLRVEAKGTVPAPCDFAGMTANDGTGEDAKTVCVVPDLDARVTLLDGDNNLLTHLGDDADWIAKCLADGRAMRRQPENWVPGKFVAPHDAAFVNGTDLLVAEWVPSGRLTYLKRA